MLWFTFLMLSILYMCNNTHRILNVNAVVIYTLLKKYKRLSRMIIFIKSYFIDKIIALQFCRAIIITVIRGSICQSAIMTMNEAIRTNAFINEDFE